MEKFDWVKFSKTVFWVILAGAVGIVTQMQAMGGADGFQFEDIDLTSAGLGMFVWGVIRSGVGFWNQQRSNYAPLKKVLMLLLMVGLSLSLSGCLTLRPSGGDQSQVQSKLHEKIGTDGSSELTIENKIHGEAATQRTVNYVGPTEAIGPDGKVYVAAPWQLTDGIVGDVTSPQSVILAQGQADLLREIPSTVDGLISQLDTITGLFGAASGGGSGGVAAAASNPIAAMLKQWVVQRFLGAIGNGPVDLDAILGGLAPSP